jgi:hypothetical protein
MATTTTNYGFDVPTSSDLVKNGATQIALLGQDLDTFLFRPFTRNGVIGGGFDWWQRGTSFTVAASTSTYTADRWIAYRGATGMTVSRQSSGLTGFNYCARIQRDNGNTSTTLIQYLTNFETIQSLPFAGQTVTLSFYARKGANYSQASSVLNVQLVAGTGTDQNALSGFTGGSAVIDSSATVLTTSWQRFSYSVTLASTVTQLATQFYYVPVGTAGAADYAEVTGVQVEVGSQVSPFTRAGGTLQGELAACQRYYLLFASGADQSLGTGGQTSSTDVFTYFKFPVNMRTAPTLAATSGTDYYRFWRNGTGDSFNSWTLLRPTTSGTLAYNNTEVSGAANNFGYFDSVSSSGFVAFTSEL